MESLNRPSNFRYNSGDSGTEAGFSGILEIFVHHARNIHNICIYDNQDVYAKFSLTYNPDETISTRVVIGGGKNPEFRQKLELKVNQFDAVIKCEIWMLSRNRKLLEDQLLGFTLVPISLITKQGGKLTCHDFSLTSTDLFHSPAGTIQLSVSLNTNTRNTSTSSPFSSVNLFHNFSGNSSISSEVVLLDPNEYSRVEFPDMNAAAEDEMMVSEYFNLKFDSNSHQQGSFLRLLRTGASEYENGSSTTMTNNSSDDHNTADSKSTQKKNTSHDSQDDARGSGSGSGSGDVGDGVFSGRVGGVGVDVEAEQAAMQQQIVDMYMKSMQQFTESLAKMKLPIGLDSNQIRNPNDGDSGKGIRIMEENSKMDVENKRKEGSRVFYGSRAFF